MEGTNRGTNKGKAIFFVKKLLAIGPNFFYLIGGK